MIEKKYVDALNEVHSYAPHVSDWITLKKMLLLVLNPNDRKAFSTRHSKTYKQTVNDFESELMKKWFVMTGQELILMHDDKEKTP